MLSSKAEGLGTAFGGMKAQISAVSSAMDTYGQTTTSTLNDANGRIDAAQQAMNSAVAELQAIQSAQDEDGKISAESLSNVINTLSGAAGSASQVDTSFAAGYSDQVSQLGVVNGEIDAVQGELGDALSQLNRKTEDIKSSVQTLTGAAEEL